MNIDYFKYRVPWKITKNVRIVVNEQKYHLVRIWINVNYKSQE